MRNGADGLRLGIGMFIPPLVGEILIAAAHTDAAATIGGSVFGAAAIGLVLARFRWPSEASKPAITTSLSPSAPTGWAEDRQRLVGQLSSGVAHDFNNLLATVLGCLELIERRLQDPERVKVLLKRASDAVERAGRLTSALVQFARRPRAEVAPLDVSEALNGVAPLIDSALGRRVSLRSDIATDLPLIVGDLATFEKNVTELCLAMRATLPEGGELGVSADAGAGAARLTVRVTGPRVDAIDSQIAARCAAEMGAELKACELGCCELLFAATTQSVG